MTQKPAQPMDVEAEQAVIGSVLIEPTCLPLVDLSPDAFFIQRHGMIYSAMLDVVNAGLALDYVTLAGRLEALHKLDEIGGSSYVTSLINAVPTAAHVETYVHKVKDAARRRKILSLAGQMAADAYNAASDLDTAQAKWMAELVTAGAGREQSRRIGEFALELECEIDDAQANPREIFGISTGFPDWDAITFGLQRKETTRLCGQPGMGKSLAAGQLALNVALADIPVAVYELEMSGVAIVRRMVSGLTRILTAKMRGGRLDHDEYQRVKARLARIADLPIYMSDATTWTGTAIRADVARRVAQNGVQLVIVDHDGLLKDRGENELAREKAISQTLQATAKDNNVALIAIHPMNKAGLRSTLPTLADSIGSVSNVFDADNVCFWTQHLPQNGEPEQSNVRTLTYPKAREGEKDRYCHFQMAEVQDERGIVRSLPRLETVTRY
jgi:replicative DNA helicase